MTHHICRSQYHSSLWETLRISGSGRQAVKPDTVFRERTPSRNKEWSDGHQQTACQRKPVLLRWWIWGWSSVHSACIMRAREDRGSMKEGLNTAQWTGSSQHKQTLLCGDRDRDPHLSPHERASTEKEEKPSSTHHLSSAGHTHLDDRSE